MLVQPFLAGVRALDTHVQTLPAPQPAGKQRDAGAQVSGMEGLAYSRTKTLKLRPGKLVSAMYCLISTLLYQLMRSARTT